ncbi:FMRFamide receptor [Plakobranchus ocellatus]|uniref:FMRFamide receptor n=1 Tax=Plakobranchus ocellatus TaxID=259542 RepID=A0AAV3WW69_9GAST|nr:FMRFamide receptor [Plakobranchus ocellatus]
MAQYIGLIETMTTTPFPWSEDLLTFVESSNISEETTAASNCLTNFTLNSTLACSNTSATLNCQPVENKPTLRMIVEIQRWIGPPVLIFGILSNILTLLTLRGMDLSPYVHLSWLAIADLSGLVLILIDHYNDPSDRQWMMFRIYVYYPLSNLAAMMGVWIMVLVTLERCIFIRYMMAPLWCTPSRARAKVGQRPHF